MRRLCANWGRLFFRATIAATLGLGLGCAGVVLPGSGYDYFASPDLSDPWSPKIAGWQRRERAPAPAPAPVADGEKGSVVLPDTGPGLRAKYVDFRAGQRRAVARGFAEWIQSEAKKHYVTDGPVDHWATLEETLRENGDDCDGLELLVYQALRDLGFGEDEVFRSIVVRSSDGQHHMVTMWFEDASDPWVIDPTGAMVRGMHRMSDIPGWVPLKVFSDSDEYSVRPSNSTAGALARR